MRERTLRAGSATPCENASDAKKRRPAVKHRSRKATLRDDLKLTEDGSIGCHYRTLLCGSLKKKLAARRGEPRHSRGWGGAVQEKSIVSPTPPRRFAPPLLG